MVRVSVLYQNSEEARFDLDYYTNTHMALVWKVLGPRGLVRAEVDRGVNTLGDEPSPCVAVGHIYFESVAQFQQAFAEGVEDLFDDVPNYTNIDPVLQVSEITEVAAS